MEKKEIAAKIEELETRLQQVKGTECEVYSRIVGYFRPVKQWNNGKQEEYRKGNICSRTRKRNSRSFKLNGDLII